MTTIEYDSVEILNTTYIPRFVKHESTAERLFNIGELSREDGGILISERYGSKSIILQGILVGSSVSDLESKVNVFKELFSRVSKNLDIDWAGGTLRYVANCRSHNFDRDHFNLNFVPWTAEFIVISGIGEDEDETALTNATFSTWQKTGSWTFGGSAKPKPRIRIHADIFSATNPKGVQIKNTGTGERIVITRLDGMYADADFEVDCRLKTAKYESVERKFYGVFPQFIVGANAFEITVGEILDQSFSNLSFINSSYEIYDVNYKAMSFVVPNSDDTYQVIQLYLKKNGSPPSDLKVYICGDDGGVPNISDVKAVFTIAKESVGSSAGWVRGTADAGAFELVANVSYWIVCWTTDGDGGNNFIWYHSSGAVATYPRGNMNLSNDSGVSWEETGFFNNYDCLFKLYYGGLRDTGKTYHYFVDYYKRYL